MPRVHPLNLQPAQMRLAPAAAVGDDTSTNTSATCCKERARAHELERRLAAVQLFAPGAGVAYESSGMAEQQSSPVVAQRMTCSGKRKGGVNERGSGKVRGAGGKDEGGGRQKMLGAIFTNDDFTTDDVGHLLRRERWVGGGGIWGERAGVEGDLLLNDRETRRVD